MGQSRPGAGGSCYLLCTRAAPGCGLLPLLLVLLLLVLLHTLSLAPPASPSAGQGIVQWIAESAYLSQDLSYISRAAARDAPASPDTTRGSADKDTAKEKMQKNRGGARVW